MKNTHLLLIILSFYVSTINAQYLQTFEVTSLTTLVNDSGWQASGVWVGNNSKLTGSKELQTQILNMSTSSSTYLITCYYRGKGYNELQFQHVINNSSGKDITLTISALDSVNSVIGTPYIYTYTNASPVNTTWSFYSTSNYKLQFEWSGAKVCSGSSAFLDMVFVNSPFIPLPVKIFNLTAEKQEKSMLIKWNCPEMDNLNKFELFKSTNGIHFLKIGEVSLPDNSNMGINQYSVLDNHVEGMAFYKVKFTENAFQSYWSNSIRSDKFLDNEPFGNGLYPIPASHTLCLENNEEDLANATLCILDVKGQIVNTQPIMYLDKGSITNIDIDSLEPGLYFLKILKDDGIELRLMKFIKQ